MNTKFGILTHIPLPSSRERANLGDAIQSVSAQRLLPKTSIYLEREELSSYTDHRQRYLTLLNGWFMHQPEMFPPGAAILPLIISIHIDPSRRTLIMTDKAIKFFKTHQPIGCRDFYTRDMLQRYGIDAYFSGCLTLTLNREDFCDPKTKRQGIYIVDVKSLKFRYYFNRLLFPFFEWSRKKKQIISHKSRERGYDLDFSDYQRLNQEWIQRAERLLSGYATARLVITSRLHVALPCLAFGTPVLLVYGTPHDSRFSGLTESLNVISWQQALEGFRTGVWEINGKKTDWREIKNGTQYLKIREKLKAQVAQWIKEST